MVGFMYSTPPQNLVASFDRSRASDRLYTIAGIFGVVAALAFGLERAQIAHDPGYVPNFFCDLPFLIFAAIVAFFGTCFYAYKTLLGLGLTVEIYSNGFALKKGEVSKFRPWSDVQSYTHKVVK